MNLLNTIILFFRRLSIVNKQKVYDVLSPLRLVIAFSALISFIFYYGFSLPETTKSAIIMFNRGVFGFFIISFFIRLSLSGNLIQYLINSWFELLLILILIYDILIFYFFNLSLITPLVGNLDADIASGIYILLLQLYMLLLATIELLKFSNWIGRIRLRPAVIFILSFFVLICLGTGLLMLPEMNVTKQPLSLLDAFFTSASATCVTGLTVVDTATFFTIKGHIVLLFLMQVGGIGILSFATFFAYFLKKGVGIRQQSMIRDFLSEDSLLDAGKLLSQIIVFTLTIESIGVIGLYNSWPDTVFFYDSVGLKFFYALFHAVSAFCNAGFSLFPNGYLNEHISNSYFTLLLTGGLIFMGSLGFPTLRDVFSLSNIKRRLNAPWLNYKLSSQIAINASIILTVLGSIVFFLIEKDRVLVSEAGAAKWVHAVFQAISCRTAGFNSVDLAALATPTLIFMIFLMFIGASSGSTGGGIKTSTFVVIFMAVFATIRGKKAIVLNRRTLTAELVNKAYTIFLFSASFILFAVFLLSLFDGDKPILDLVFEEVSAFCTVGLSRGITPDMSSAGKIVLIVSMFIGRVGTLTLAFALASPVETNEYRYPNAHMLVG